NKPNGTCTTPKVAYTQTEYDGGWTGLAATYFENTTLTGTPKVRGIVDDLSESWGSGSPSGITPNNGWSGRFTGAIVLDSAGTYNFRLSGSSGSGARLWIDDQLIVDRWSEGLWTGTYLNADANSRKRIRVDYHDTLANPANLD